MYMWVVVSGADIHLSHFLFYSQAGIGEESDCLLGQLKRVFLDIWDSDAGLREDKSGGICYVETCLYCIALLCDLILLF